ncbi:hypothetical protein WA026_007119 [Henosepilachna vigintioctopunctata]|uniref:Uncharacterized protein n=1 Tax=Henosepilachna vigintioctopunctata TaxID=420089 RepID=A0AAW1V225_9CUCU
MLTLLNHSNGPRPFGRLSPEFIRSDTVGTDFGAVTFEFKNGVGLRNPIRPVASARNHHRLPFVKDALALRRSFVPMVWNASAGKPLHRNFERDASDLLPKERKLRSCSN